MPNPWRILKFDRKIVHKKGGTYNFSGSKTETEKELFINKKNSARPPLIQNCKILYQINIDTH